ncbi:mobile mystery protein A [Geobacter benzoatilyticus]|uniref:Mobile mystery protein A n=1 Tax=Geobacter benzoatilyticus TaxID=2815309 RepID=A0ABX7Q182_9BACT|nr:mobile mystery protein A [Geobacter benzoatilyticus]QSV44701.1 mobile mystery protein A [Geobacter benzoatilyticus]
MLPNRKRLVLEQLGKTLSRFAGVQSVSPPARGWIRAIREALGMSGVQFAARLGVKPPRVTILEREELSGTVTMKTMRQAAEALDCVFVYALVPRTSLEETIRRQAEGVARERLSRASHTMMLENQQLSEEEMKQALDAAVEELVRAMPKDLWSKAQ